MTNLWIPGLAAGPLEEWVARVHRRIETYAHDAGLEKAYVEIELADGSRYCLDSLSPEPGFGFVTLRPHRRSEDEDAPDELIVPVGAVRRIELYRAEEQRGGFGFTLPAP
jgi:hypothetical protein